MNDASGVKAIDGSRPIITLSRVLIIWLEHPRAPSYGNLANVTTSKIYLYQDTGCFALILQLL